MSIVPSPYATGAYGGFGGGYSGSSGVPGLPADTYYADPNTGPIAQNIGTALFGNAQTMRQGQLTQAEIARDQAQTQGLTQANTAQAARQAALGKISSLFSVPNPDGSTRPLTLSEMQNNSPQITQGLLSAFPENPQLGAGVARMFAGMTGNPTMQTNTMLGAGDSYGSTPGGQTQAEGARYKEGTAVAGIGAGATIQAANIRENGAMSLQRQAQENALAHPGPLTIAPGATVALTPGDPRAPLLNPPPPQPDAGRADAPPPAPNTGALFTAPARFSSDAERAQQQEAYVNEPGITQDEHNRRVREVAVTGVVNNENTVAGRVTVGAGNNAASVANTGTRAAQSDVNNQRTNETRRDLGNMKLNQPSLLNAPETLALNSEVDNQLGETGLNVDGDAKATIAARAAQLYSQHIPPQTAVQQAITEFNQSNPPQAPRSFGNLFGLRTQYGVAPASAGAPPPAAGTPGIVPTQTTAPAVAAPQGGGGLPMPRTQQDYNAVPLGGQYIGSDGQIRTKTAGGT